jgi:hypothetical protein
VSRVYQIWTPANGETEEDAREVRASTRWGAVNEWCGREWSESAGEAFWVNDGNRPTIVHVRDQEGNLTAVSVFAETDVVFRQYDEPLPTSAASQSAEGVPARSATDEQIALPQHRTSSDGENSADIAACAFGDIARAAQKKSEGEP